MHARAGAHAVLESSERPRDQGVRSSTRTEIAFAICKALKSRELIGVATMATPALRRRLLALQGLPREYFLHAFEERLRAVHGGEQLARFDRTNGGRVG